MKLGDLVHKVLAPFVAGTKYENCADCAERQRKLNAASDKVAAFLAKITCSCYWKGLLSKLLTKK